MRSSGAPQTRRTRTFTSSPRFHESEARAAQPYLQPGDIKGEPLAQLVMVHCFAQVGVGHSQHGPGAFQPRLTHFDVRDPFRKLADLDQFAFNSSKGPEDFVIGVHGASWDWQSTRSRTRPIKVLAASFDCDVRSSRSRAKS